MELPGDIPVSTRSYISKGKRTVFLFGVGWLSGWVCWMAGCLRRDGVGDQGWGEIRGGGDKVIEVRAIYITL